MLGHAAALCGARFRGDPGVYDARSTGFALKACEWRAYILVFGAIGGSDGR
jgi:hypothetical protein